MTCTQGASASLRLAGCCQCPAARWNTQSSAWGLIVKTTNPKPNKADRVSVKDPDTDEVHVPWGTMHEQLVELGLINAEDRNN